MSETNNFLIQKHSTNHSHLDLFMQHGNEIKSWVIPNGIPIDKKDKKIAIETETQIESLEKLEFNEIFEDSYGKGKTELWDRGSYWVETCKEIKIIIKANGDKLNGIFLLHVPNWGRWTKKRLWTIEKIS